MKKSKSSVRTGTLARQPEDSEFAFRAFLVASMTSLIALTIFAGYFSR